MLTNKITGDWPMGMAASQARYLALVARKSNCEYEGQQINQARLLLSNQSANLFNQMLGLTVPVPPSTQDFTTTQYSFTDGVHNFVVDSWKQLSSADPEYNYIVDVHYYTDVYTGSMKRMPDPQVQMSNPTSPVASILEIEAKLTALNSAKYIAESKYQNWKTVESQQNALIEQIKSAAKTAMQRAEITSDINFANTNAFPGGTYYDIENSDGSRYDTYVFDDAENLGSTTDAEKILQELRNMLDLGVISLDQINADILVQDPSLGLLTNASDLDFDGTFTATQLGVLKTYGLAKEIDATNTPTGNEFIVKAKDLDTILETDFTTATASMSGYPVYDSNGSISQVYINDIQTRQAVTDAAATAYYLAKADYETALNDYNSLNQPSYVGNSPLTYLATLTDEQKIELLQVVDDMKEQGIDTDIINRFDANGNYLGGVYSFSLYGTTYYTTYDNLIDAYNSATVSNNLIDAQARLPYYNASYINTRIEEESKALLATDGSGRFTSVRFENDSVTYTLNMETITDNEAYEDAMNKYYYENAKYDKMVQDINAKTSIIQREDQELELRLKQLDTEQNALKTEMDAVQKVVKDNVESTFKTFGG